MKKRKRYIKIILIIVVLLGIYLNRSYAHIYATITHMPLPASNSQTEYIIGDTSKGSLIYVALGDSLTAGVGVDRYQDSYPYQIAQNLTQESQQQVKLIPIAIPGAKTKDVTNQMIQQIVQSNPDIITVLLGVNDIHGGISQDEFIKNYTSILDQITSSTSAHIYVINIPYIGGSSLILPPHNFYFKYKTKEFNEALQELAEKYSSVLYIDLYSQTLDILDEKAYYTSDLFHPSVVGYTLWASYIYDNFNR